jgi:hypothetical protein
MLQSLKKNWILTSVNDILQKSGEEQTEIAFMTTRCWKLVKVFLLLPIHSWITCSKYIKLSKLLVSTDLQIH